MVRNLVRDEKSFQCKDFLIRFLIIIKILGLRRDFLHGSLI
jgi:hypothetical protein